MGISIKYSVDVPFSDKKKVKEDITSYERPELTFLSAIGAMEWNEKVNGQFMQVVYEGEDGDGRIHIYGKTPDAQLDPYLLAATEPFKAPYMEELFETMFNRKPFILCAEGISPKNQGKCYGFKEEAKLILFDIQNFRNKAFWSSDRLKDVVSKINDASGSEVLKYVGDPFAASIEEVAMLTKEQPILSQFSADGVKTAIEGFVGRSKLNLRDNNGNRIIAKVKVETLTGHGPEHHKAVLSYEEATARFRG